MYFLGWIILIAIGLGASLFMFFWAIRTGQFSEQEQERARYLPLSDEFSLPQVEHPAKLSREVYALLFVFGIGVTVLVSTLLMTILRVRG